MSATRTVYLLKEGDQLGDYTVVRPLGAGGMGEVYLVEHRHLRKRYAMKILPADVAEDGTFIERFRIEARVMADLEHPGIVRVHNFGSDKGRYFLVMDYVSGPDGSPRTLDDELAWGAKLPERAVTDIACQLCDALEYAHTFPAGAIIHRDLKPGNILIHKPGSQSTGGGGSSTGEAPRPETRVKIADFGLAKIIGDEYIRAVIDRSTHLTAMPLRNMSPEVQATQVDTPGSSSGSGTVSLLGTYDYMSPEQKTGAPVDARSDLYALGLIIYRMLTGHKPEGTYDPPSRSGVNRRWDPVLAKCLKRERNERYQTAAELKNAILAIGIPVYRRVPLVITLPIAAALLGALTVLSMRAPSTAPASDPGPVVKPATPDEVTIGFTIQVRPAGSTVTLSRGREVVIDKTMLDKTSHALKLKPGVYAIRLERPGYRTVEQQFAVGDGLPRTWSAVMEEAFGFLHYWPTEGQELTVLDSAGNKMDLDRPERMEGGLVFKLPIGRYEALVIRPDHVPGSRSLEIMEGRPVDLRIKLDPLPGSLVVESVQSATIWDRGRQIGLTGDTIRDLAAGPHLIEVKRPGYRTAKFEVEIPPNGSITAKAPELVEEHAELTVDVNVRAHGIQSGEQPRNARLRIGEGAEQSVELPHTVRVTELGRGLPVRLSMDGYQETPVEHVQLRDGEQRTVTFRVYPLPVTLTIAANVQGAAIYRLRDGQPATGLKRFIFGRDLPVGKTGEPMEVNAFEDLTFSITADGYEPAVTQARYTTPGVRETLTVELAPELP